MVVNHIQKDGQTAIVTSVDQLPQTGGPAVGVMRRIEGHAVISPAVIAREFVDRHEFHMRHAESHEVIELFDGGLEGPAGRECANVELVKDGGGQRRGPARFRVPAPCRERVKGHARRAAATASADRERGLRHRE